MAVLERTTQSTTTALEPTTPSARQPVMETDELSVHFGPRSALDCVSIQLHPSETVSLLGPNGAGKSTLLKALAGMLPSTHGRVRLSSASGSASGRASGSASGRASSGTPVRGPSPRVVYVPQRSGVDWSFPMDVLDVALMGRGLRRSRLRPLAAADRDDALAALERVGMAALAEVQIGALSGGQQQRVFLARALLQGGDVFLLDEPFTGVDVPTQRLLVALFARLRDGGKTIVYATHDLALAAASSDRVLLLDRRIVADGPPDVAMTAANLRATFGGQAVLLPVALDGRSA